MKYVDYISIARPDHWPKHIFILPGIILAYILAPNIDLSLTKIFIGLSSACLLASANYVINEWLDAPFDRYHPIKKNRPLVKGNISRMGILIEYSLLVVAGIYLSTMVGTMFLLSCIIFICFALLYNVKPFRMKDRVYADILLESLNSPLRLLFGWFMLSGNTIPPYSIVLFYWFGGAFLMSTKRLGEYRQLIGTVAFENLTKYRQSFGKYTEKSLLLSAYFYTMLSTFNISIFLVKYKIELILIFPAIAILFTYYLSISYKDYSIVQTPEKLFLDKYLMLLIAFIVILFSVLLVIEIPILLILSESFITKIY